MRDRGTGVYARAKAMLALSKIDAAKISAARMKVHDIVLPDSNSRTGVLTFKVEGLKLAKFFDLELPAPATSVPLPPDYLCLYCCSLRLEDGPEDYKLSCCGAHACSPCLTTALGGVFAKGQRINRGLAKCTQCFQFMEMNDVKALNPETDEMLQALFRLIVEEQHEVKEEVQIGPSEALSRFFYVTCDANECKVVLNAGPYDCNTHGFFTSCPEHRLNMKEVRRKKKDT